MTTAVETARPLPTSKELFDLLFADKQRTFLTDFDRIVLILYVSLLAVLLVAIAWSGGTPLQPELMPLGAGAAFLLLLLGFVWLVVSAISSIAILFKGSQTFHSRFDRSVEAQRKVLSALSGFDKDEMKIRAQQYSLESSLAMRRHGLTAVIVGLSAASTPIYQKGVEYELWARWDHFPYVVAFALLGAFLLSAALIDLTSKLDRAAAMLTRAALDH